MALGDFFKRKKNKEKLDQGLEKTRSGIFNKLARAVAGKSKVDDLVLDDLEEILISSDVGVETTVKIIERIEARVERDKYGTSGELQLLLRDEILQLIKENAVNEDREAFQLPALTQDGKKIPYVLMVVGVNGVGKTTTIGKLAHRFKNQGYKVVLGAADTFRAAAVDQLKLWAKRVDVEIVENGMHVDPAAVAFEAVEYGVRHEADIVIVDTAGRLHNKVNLMNELTKIKRSMGRHVGEAPHEVLLVLDASTGQNAFLQAKAFTEATQVNSLALTKLDGTAKGGVVIGVSAEMQVPVKYIGVGEGTEDLQVFDPQSFVHSLFGEVE